MAVQFAPTSSRTVGDKNPIELPGGFCDNLGRCIWDGKTKIHNVRGSTPQRVYKLIPESHLQDGDEIRITQIAADLGVAPAFHRAFLTSESVVLEMDFAGKALKDLVRDVIPYGGREAFYLRVLKKVKTLAENKIAYMDLHAGNIIPGPEDVQLIDFGLSEIVPNTSTAIYRLEQSRTIWWLEDFERFPDLSQESQDLIAWFRNQPKLSVCTRFTNYLCGRS